MILPPISEQNEEEETEQQPELTTDLTNLTGKQSKKYLKSLILNSEIEMN